MRIGGQLLESFDEQLSHVERRRLSYMQKMATVLGRRVWDNAGSPDVDTKRLMVSVGLALAQPRNFSSGMTIGGQRACGR